MSIQDLFSTEDEALQNDDFDECEPMKGEIHNHLEENIRPYIDLIDNLRSVGVQKDLALPTIAVIGDQSSGKSSVLEALSGVALPRGTGIVTRCPLELRLKKVPGGLNWRAVLSYRGKVEVEIVDESHVEELVKEAQDKVAGKGVGISDKLITLEVMSPDVCDLTLIDLPGITRVPVDGQPQDIGNKIKKLIMKFIGKEETIIMVVVPCNTDIATTEALKMAQEVDPEGKRTLAIMTKPDLIDPGTERNVLAIAQNQVVRLSKGYCVVKCRGQQHINDNVSLEEATEMEEEFFRAHKVFRCLLAEDKATVKCLSVKLTKHLIEHIKKSLPQLKEEIKRLLWTVSNELKKCENGPPQDPKGAKRFLIQTLIKFNEGINSLAKGELILDENLFIQLRAEFSEWNDRLTKTKTIFKENTIKEDFQNHRGRELPGFSNYSVFEAFLQKHVHQLQQPATELLCRTKEIILKQFNDVSKQHFSSYPKLQNITENKIENIQSSQQAKAELRISEQFEMEIIIFTQDAIYLEKMNKLEHKVDSFVEALPKFTKEELPLFDIKSTYREMLQAYYEIMVQRLADQLPLMIRFFMLKESAELLSTDMFSLVDEANVSELLHEDSESSKKRKELQAQLDRLTKGQDALKNFM